MGSTPKVNAADGAASLEAQRRSPPLSRKSASSTSSFKSVLSQIRIKNLSLEEQLGNLESEYSRKEEAIMDERDELIDHWEATDDEIVKDRIKNKINRLGEKLSRTANHYQREKAGLERSLAASKQMEKLEEDNEQALDSGDEAAVRAFDNSQKREGGNPKAELAHPPIVEPAPSPKVEPARPTIVEPAIPPMVEPARTLKVEPAKPAVVEVPPKIEPAHPPQARENLNNGTSTEIKKTEVNVAGRTMVRATAAIPEPIPWDQRTMDYSFAESHAAEPNHNWRGNVEAPRQWELPQAQQQWELPQAQQQREFPQSQAYYGGYRSEPPAQDQFQGLATALRDAFGNRGSSYDKRLPEFNGDPGQWEMFKASYDRTTAKYQMDNAENLSRLQQALKGEARDSVHHLMANINNVDTIMTTLKDRFGRAEFVLDYLVERAKLCKPPDPTRPKTVMEFGTAIQALVTNIVSFNEGEYLCNKQIVTELVDKMPSTMKNSWYKWLVENVQRRPILKFFSEWIALEMKIAQLQIKPVVQMEERKERKRDNKDSSSKRSYGIHATEKDDSSSKCVCCGKDNHNLDKCFKFKKMKYKERKALAREKGACFRCLATGHLSTKCPDAVACDQSSCGSRESHHPLLHFIQETNEKKSENLAEAEAVKELNAISARANILPIIPVTLKGPKKKMRVYALLDSGSSFCALEEEVADSLGLTGEKRTLKYTVYGAKREEKSKEVSLQISGDFDRAPSYQIKSAFTVQQMKLNPRSLDAEKMKAKFPHLSKMKTKTIRNARPQLVLGTNVGGLFAAREILELNPGDVPAAVRSLLGWYLIEDEESAEKCFQFSLKDQEMHEDIREFVALENLSVKEVATPRSIEDQKALNFMEANTKKDGNRWITRLSWRNVDEVFPPSLDMAIKRLYGMERKMDKDPDFAKLCEEKFQEYISSGFLKKVNDPETVKSNQQWFLPWFFAYHPSKKPRLVFDAAAKSCGKSLNDFLMTGPDLLRPIHSVLLRFRRHQVAITADIKSMFHQVGLDERDHPSQTILYRGSRREGEPDHFHMTVLFFGAASSPSLACYAKNRNALMFEKQYPEAVKAALLDTYMDDCLTGSDTDESALQLHEDLVKIHDAGSFPLVKWSSSSKEVLKRIPKDIRAEGALNFYSKEENWEKTLGLLWNPDCDEFSFALSKQKIPEAILSGEIVPTKRMVASVVMSVFDPLGFLASLKVKGLLIIQRIWRAGLGWDDEIPANIFEDWKAWLSELQTVVEVRIPRKLCPFSLSEAESIQLHVFCDASEEAFACAVYLRIKMRGSVYTPLVMGKVRVGPLKTLTVPRMELNAALIGTRTAKAVKESFGNDLNIEQEFFWSDSRTVLAWIRADNKRFKIYVANRVGEILENSDQRSWRWVPSKENVADDATRMNQVGVTSESRWLMGPSFLKLEQENWPKEAKQEVDEDELELKSIQTATKGVKEDDDVYMPNAEKFSSWYRLLRATAMRYPLARYVWDRFDRRDRMYQAVYYITVEDLRNAEDLLVKRHQEECFPEELEALKNGKDVDKKSRLRKLSPALNSKGIIVMRSRLENSNLNERVKFPPILDPSDHYTKLLVSWFHKIGQHFGQERIISELRRRAWILNIRNAVKRCKSECFTCKIRYSKPIVPEMGQLPISRVRGGERPFYDTGVDYFGPITVKLGRKTIKRWGVIFTCLAIRAVHLEVADSLETSEFINCLVRFINLRGPPAHLYSDNGTNFVGAERELRENLEKWDQPMIRENLQRREIEWHFIPPASPHMGGTWERLIRSTKRIMMTLLKDQTPTEGTLRTVFAEIIGIMNSRPITTVSPDHEDSNCLTPNDLLQVKCVAGPTVAGEYDDHDKIRDSWRKGQRIAEEFWRRWSSEYLPWLAQRQKWNAKTDPLKVGDLVLVLEDNAPRNLWKKGLITQVFPSKDGQVRSAEVKIVRVDESDVRNVRVCYYKRPVVKLCPLIC